MPLSEEIHPNLAHAAIHPGNATTSGPPLTNPPDAATSGPDGNLEAPKSKPQWRHVKLTLYRVLSISILLGFGLVKTIQSFHNASVSVTWLEFAGGSLVASLWYYIGLYESMDPPVAEWFFHVDLSPGLYRTFSPVFLVLGAYACAIACFALVYLVFFLVLLPFKHRISEQGCEAIRLCGAAMVCYLASIIVVGRANYKKYRARRYR